MNIAVIGAGIVGITTAYELARDGHTVTIIERRSAVAEQCSFSNAGVVAPACVGQWAAPGISWKFAKRFLQAHSAVRVSWPLSAADLSWMWQFWQTRSLRIHQKQRSALQKLAIYSKSQLSAITNRHALEYDRSSGYLIVLRTEQDREMLRCSLSELREIGLVLREVDEAGAREIEPAINPDTRFAGGIHLVNDEVANCRQFALLLKEECKAMGVRFEFGKIVTHLAEATRTAKAGVTVTTHATEPVGRQIQTADPATTDINHHEQTYDCAVLCTGAQGSDLLAAQGVRLALRPVYGYSVSAQIKESHNAPRSGMLDEHYGVSITRLGQRVRVSGTAQLGGRLGQLNPGALRTLYKVLQDWFPGAAIRTHGVQEWQGARPVLANRALVIDRAHANSCVWLNLGHGSSGWTLAAGAARVLADRIGGRSSQTDFQAFTLS